MHFLLDVDNSKHCSVKDEVSEWRNLQVSHLTPLSDSMLAHNNGFRRYDDEKFKKRDLSSQK